MLAAGWNRQKSAADENTRAIMNTQCKTQNITISQNNQSRDTCDSLLPSHGKYMKCAAVAALIIGMHLLDGDVAAVNGRIGEVRTGSWRMITTGFLCSYASRTLLRGSNQCTWWMLWFIAVSMMLQLSSRGWATSTVRLGAAMTTPVSWNHMTAVSPVNHTSDPKLF